MNRSMKAHTGIFVGITAAVLIGMAAGICDFVYHWHIRGDIFAQAEGMLLTFVAASVSVLVTLAFVYLTRRSIEAAQDAIQLQKESLRTTERAIDLEREKWDLQLRVAPRMWLDLSGKSKQSDSIPYRSTATSVLYSQTVPEVMCYVWNPGQQSFRVRSVRCWLTNEPKMSRTKIVPGLVVAPHSVNAVDITINLTNILHHCPGPEDVYDPKTIEKPSEEVGVAMEFDSWLSNADTTQEVKALFLIDTQEGIGKIKVERTQ